MFDARLSKEYKEDVMPLRILIVENNPYWQIKLSELVMGWGHTPIVALAPDACADPEQGLLDDAVKKIAEYRCHIAIVDICLKHDGDPKDHSGLDLIPQLVPASPIIVSGYADMPEWRKAKSLGADFFKKSEDPDSLRFAIENLAQEKWHQKSTVKIDWQHPEFKDSHAVVQRFFPGDPGVPKDEVDLVLRQLFPEASEKITITDLRKSTDTPTLMLRPRSLVVKVLVDKSPLPKVVKLMRLERVDKEVDGYKLVSSAVTAAHFAYQPRDPVKLWDLGGLRYFLVGGGASFDLFSEFYRASEDCSNIFPVLHSLKQLWSPFYNSGESQAISLFKAYSKVWGEGWYDELVKLGKGLTLGDYPGILSRLELKDPIAWLGRKKEKSLLGATRIAITHGDLQGDNIFVDHNRNAWVIDYERTGPGPILQDWVELETDIITRLATAEISELGHLFRIALVTFASKELGVNLQGGPASANKVFGVIGEIRGLAQDISGVTDAREYYWGLLLNKLFRLGILLKQRECRNSEVDGPLIDHANQVKEDQLGIPGCLLLAAMLCHRLDHWEMTPEQWSKTMDVAAEGSASPPPQHPLPTLHLQLTDLHNAQREFVVRVLDASNQQPHASSKSPYDNYELVVVMKLLEFGEYKPDQFDDTQLAALQRLKLLSGDALAEDWIDRVGSQMYESLVPSKNGVRTAFENILHVDRWGGNLKLSFDENAAALVCYPWEAIHDGYPTHPRTAIDVVRYITSDRRAQELEVPAPPCRILYVSARPQELAQVKLDREVVKKSVASSASPGRFIFEELRAHTHQSLKTRLLDTAQPPIHVLHFDGHGTFARLCPHPQCKQLNHPHLLICDACGKSLTDILPRGYLAFETYSGEVDFVDTIKMLEGIPRSHIRLAVLSSCQSARVRGADLLLAGVGPGLILGGVPAVVAMQFSITSRDAISFNQEFYKALTEGDVLPNAVNRARTMLPEPAKWSPVLYLRSRNHQVRLCPQV